jgi:polyisoprenyl-teichoic acid--peptidoglycan teichoic acid transferase
MKYIDLKANTRSRTKQKVRPARLILVGFIVLVSVIVIAVVKNGLSSLFTPVSVFSKISGETVAQDDGYTNILLLGLDRRSDENYSGGLNDTIIVVSINHTEDRAILFSIPRDLWVPLGKKGYGKINSTYNFGGVELSEKVVENVLGIPIHYYAVVDFEGFTRAVDTLGGIDVFVERGFDDYYYPIPGKENVYPETDRYEHVSFQQGLQHMDGALALKFARSRHALGPEGSDFARANRQQRVILSAKEKAFSTATLFSPSKLKSLYEIFGSSVQTNISVVEAQQLYEISRDFSTDSITPYVIDRESESGESLLYTPQNLEGYDGLWVLVPRAGDFTEVQRQVHQLLFVAE